MMSGRTRPAPGHLPGATRTVRVALAIVYLAAGWLFGGLVGLAIGLAVIVARVAFGIGNRDYWIGAVAAMIAAPVATVAQGLPHSAVVGPQFGESHIAAHILVGVSLSLATFAGLLELDRTRWRPPVAPRARGRARAVGRVAVRGAGVAGHGGFRGVRAVVRVVGRGLWAVARGVARAVAAAARGIGRGAAAVGRAVFRGARAVVGALPSWRRRRRARRNERSGGDAGSATGPGARHSKDPPPDRPPDRGTRPPPGG